MWSRAAVLVAIVASLLVLAGDSQGRGAPRAEAGSPPALEMYLDVVEDGDICDPADTAAAVLVGYSHKVQICVRGHLEPINAFDARVIYTGGGVPANQLNLAPEVPDAPLSGSLDDNPDANQGGGGSAGAPVQGGLGPGTTCAFGPSPKGDYPDTANLSDTFVFCVGATGDSDLLYQDGFLLATIDFVAVNLGLDPLTWRRTRTYSPTTVRRSGR